MYIKSIAILGIVVITTSCSNSENQIEEKAVKEQNSTFKLDKNKEEKDVYAKVSNYIERYQKSSNSVYLDSALFNYKKILVKYPLEVFPIIYCGMLSELSNDEKAAHDYYLTARRIALQNKSNPEKLLKEGYSTIDLQELEKQNKMPKEKILSSIIESQEFALLWAKILLNEHTDKDLIQFNELAKKTFLPFSSNSIVVGSRDDLFMIIKGME